MAMAARSSAVTLSVNLAVACGYAMGMHRLCLPMEFVAAERGLLGYMSSYPNAKTTINQRQYGLNSETLCGMQGMSFKLRGLEIVTKGLSAECRLATSQGAQTHADRC